MYLLIASYFLHYTYMIFSISLTCNGRIMVDGSNSKNSKVILTSTSTSTYTYMEVHSTCLVLVLVVAS